MSALKSNFHQLRNAEPAATRQRLLRLERQWEGAARGSQAHDAVLKGRSPALVPLVLLHFYRESISPNAQTEIRYPTASLRAYAQALSLLTGKSLGDFSLKPTPEGIARQREKVGEFATWWLEQAEPPVMDYEQLEEDQRLVIVEALLSYYRSIRLTPRESASARLYHAYFRDAPQRRPLKILSRSMSGPLLEIYAEDPQFRWAAANFLVDLRRLGLFPKPETAPRLSSWGQLIRQVALWKTGDELETDLVLALLAESLKAPGPQGWDFDLISASTVLLGYAGSAEANRRLIDLASHEHPDIRAAALWGLAAASPLEALPLLVERLDAPELAVREEKARAVIRALERIGTPEAVAALENFSQRARLSSSTQHEVERIIRKHRRSSRANPLTKEEVTLLVGSGGGAVVTPSGDNDAAWKTYQAIKSLRVPYSRLSAAKVRQILEGPIEKPEFRWRNAALLSRAVELSLLADAEELASIAQSRWTRLLLIIARWKGGGELDTAAVLHLLEPSKSLERENRRIPGQETLPIRDRVSHEEGAPSPSPEPLEVELLVAGAITLGFADTEAANRRLVELLDHDNREVWVAAAWGLRESKYQAAVPALAKRLTNLRQLSQRNHAMSVIHALGAIKTPAAQAALASYVAREDVDVSLKRDALSKLRF